MFKKFINWKSFIFFLLFLKKLTKKKKIKDFFWPHLNSNFSLLKFVKLIFKKLFGHVLKMYSHLMLNPSWDANNDTTLKFWKKYHDLGPKLSIFKKYDGNSWFPFQLMFLVSWNFLSVLNLVLHIHNLWFLILLVIFQTRPNIYFLTSKD